MEVLKTEDVTHTATQAPAAVPAVKGNYGLHLFKLFIVGLALVAGFVAGHVVTKDRYLEKISEISKMNMEKAVAVDHLREQVAVLGAKTEAKK